MNEYILEYELNRRWINASATREGPIRAYSAREAIDKANTLWYLGLDKHTRYRATRVNIKPEQVIFSYEEPVEGKWKAE